MSPRSATVARRLSVIARHVNPPPFKSRGSVGAKSVLAVRTRGRTKVRTRTKTKRGGRREKAKETREGSEAHFFWKQWQVPRSIYKQLKQQPWAEYNLNQVWQVTATAGRQAFDGTANYFSIAHLGNMFGQIQNQLPGTAPNTLTPLGAYGTAVYFDKVMAETMIENGENVGVRVILYEIMARQDLHENDAGGGIDPVSCIIQGVTDATAKAYNNMGGTDVHAMYGITPFESSLFCQYYKVLKSTQLMLAPGQVHTHVVEIKPRKYLRWESLQDGLEALHRFGYYTLMLAYGLPVISGTANTPTTAPVSINCINKMTYKFKNVPLITNLVNYNNLLTTTSNTGVMDLTEAVTKAPTAAS